MNKLVVIGFLLLLIGCSTQSSHLPFEISEDNLKTFDLQGGELSSIPKKRYERIVVLNTPILAYFEALLRLDRVVGVPHKNRLAVEIRACDLGDDQVIDPELLLQINPDLIIANSYQLNALQLFPKEKILVVDEFLSNHPIQKAAWILFFGELLNQKTLAHEKFQGIQKLYQKKPLKEIKVLPLNYYSGTWFLPGSESNVTHLVQDAGFNLMVHGTGSVNGIVSQERLIALANEADFYLFFDWNQDSSGWVSRSGIELLKEFQKPVLYCNTMESQFFHRSILAPFEFQNALIQAVEAGEKSTYIYRIEK